jgi:3-dehydroquinate synthase
MKSNLTYLKKLELFKELDNFKDGQFFAVADQSIKNHMPQWILFSPHIFWLKHPEEEKNLDIYGRAIEFFLKQGINRSSTLYGIGGGATTDFAGFVASTILRGIKWQAIPTTLLAMIDGAIGGKVALNMPQGKNLVGNFHSPERVYICGDFLTSLPDKEWFSGKGEMLKYGLLSPQINNQILNKAPIEKIAFDCAAYKNEVVERDFKEEGERIYLNLGHTLGHAFEFSLKIPHGHAVAMGIKYIFKIMNQTDAYNEWEKMVKALGLPVEKLEISSFHNFEVSAICSYLEHDKKKINNTLRLVLVKEIGFCYVHEISMKEFITKIQSYAEFKS